MQNGRKVEDTMCVKGAYLPSKMQEQGCTKGLATRTTNGKLVTSKLTVARDSHGIFDVNVLTKLELLLIVDSKFAQRPSSAAHRK